MGTSEGRYTEMFEQTLLEQICPKGQPQSLQHVDWVSVPDLHTPFPQISIIVKLLPGTNVNLEHELLCRT
jgi:hypothetical protein